MGQLDDDARNILVGIAIGVVGYYLIRLCFVVINN